MLQDLHWRWPSRLASRLRKLMHEAVECKLLNDLMVWQMALCSKIWFSLTSFCRTYLQFEVAKNWQTFCKSTRQGSPFEQLQGGGPLTKGKGLNSIAQKIVQKVRLLTLISHSLRNPAPADMVKIPLFTRFHTCWGGAGFLPSTVSLFFVHPLGGFHPPDITILEDHPTTRKWLITMVILSPPNIGWWDPFPMA